jgi:hypothetical protein
VAGSSLTLGLEWLTGNSRTFVLFGQGLAEYDSPRWILTAETEGTYIVAQPAGGSGEADVANRVSGWARGERRFTPLLTTFLYAGSASNHFASLDLRLEAEAGLGFTILERHPGAPDELVLRLYLGAHYTRDERFQYYPTPANVPDQEVWSPGLAMTFRARLNERVKLSEYAFLFPASARTLVRSETKLLSTLTGPLALTADFILESNSAPAPGKARTDTMLTLGLTLEL